VCPYPWGKYSNFGSVLNPLPIASDLVMCRYVDGFQNTEMVTGWVSIWIYVPLCHSEVHFRYKNVFPWTAWRSLCSLSNSKIRPCCRPAWLGPPHARYVALLDCDDRSPICTTVSRCHENQQDLDGCGSLQAAAVRTTRPAYSWHGRTVCLKQCLDMSRSQHSSFLAVDLASSYMLKVRQTSPKFDFFSYTVYPKERRNAARV